MITELWSLLLYQPLYNLLIEVYNGFSGESLGWAIVVLTVLLRIVLLPFSVIHEMNTTKNEQLYKEIKELSQHYKDDPILQKEEVRKMLKKKKIKPWASAVLLGIQGLVLLLLYQVFIQGVSGEHNLSLLYKSVDFPGVINTQFFGADLKDTHNVFWAGFVGLYIFLEILLEYRANKKKGVLLEKKDLSYFFLFPLFSFVVLWFLPMAKSVFILTSLIFSTVVHMVSGVFKPKQKEPQQQTV